MLTDADCRNAACPAGLKRRRLTDAAGLYLEVSPAGSKRWFWKFYPEGKESRLALGSYPEVTLKAARAARDDARKTRQAGTNPVQKRKADALTRSSANAVTFEAVARELHDTKAEGWSPKYAVRWLERMEKDLFPHIGTLPLTSVTAPLLLGALRRVEKRGAIETAQSLRKTAGQVFRYGIATGRAERNPVPDLAGALRTQTVKHMAALTDPVRVGELMRAIDAYPGQPATQVALVLSALFFQRPGNIRSMEWAHIDLETRLWTIPSADMKRRAAQKLNGRPHLVPLATQAVAALRDMKRLSGAGGGRYVFPSMRSGERCMSENTVRVALRTMGFSNDDMSPHGFRSMARTMLAERVSGIAPDIVEAQLAHAKSGPLGMAYDRAEYLDQRRTMMQTWADYLDRLRDGAQVLPFKAA